MFRRAGASEGNRETNFSSAVTGRKLYSDSPIFPALGRQKSLHRTFISSFKAVLVPNVKNVHVGYVDLILKNRQSCVDSFMLLSGVTTTISPFLRSLIGLLIVLDGAGRIWAVLLNTGILGEIICTVR